LDDFLSPFLPLFPLASSSDEASVSAFAEEEEANSRLLESLSLSIFLWRLSYLSSEESCSTRESLEAPSKGVVFPPEASPLGGGGTSLTPSLAFDIASPSD
jgi:hypothetical protein